ncbi:flagellar biosynthesis protein FlhB [Candidatus Aerophobetes bacterium]|uniref:Flagellar biosynthetic protein FlhB n=1 Tax=Aerophobetes bacterium TaxID=2030807 RepID=A0A662DET5_UNCAE|nr:MAG: flagellar biosynthesis protein FlhB [Candidatus Aerophobetes bacterium]
MPQEEKIHPPTPRRRRRARRRGQVAKSMEINSLLVLTGGIVLLKFLGYPLFASLLSLSRNIWSELFYFTSASPDICLKLKQALLHTALHLLPFFLLVAGIALAANIVQVGFVFSFYPLAPDPGRINPVRGLKRIFSTQALMRLLISLLKITIVGYIAYLTVRGQLPVIFSLTGQEIGKIFVTTLRLAFYLILSLCLGIAPLALLDYVFQRRRYERELRMSPEELKEEYKQTEGNPLTKSRIRSLQRQILRSRMMQKVPQADVVITNPVHLAVALQYERERMNAPVVVAKGAGLIAEKIKEVARKHKVPIVENKWLAQMLYRSVEIGEEIPVKLYQAVAEILAYIYRLKGKGI